MFRVVYVSSAARHFTGSQLTEFAACWRKLNADHAITGLLLYIGGNFMQAFEGSQASALALYHNIRSDYRHTGMTDLFLGEDPTGRLFPDWSLEFREAADMELPLVRPLNSFIETTLNEGPDGRASIAMQLLSQFVIRNHLRLTVSTSRFPRQNISRERSSAEKRT